jgi:hypothetical protein
MNLNNEFFIVPTEVFRMGNSSSPRMNMVRASEIDTTEINGICAIIANGRGVSIYTKQELENTNLTGWVWRFPANTLLPIGLKLVNDKPGHYCVAPTHNMPLDLYKGLLEDMGMKAEKVWRKIA